MGKGQTVLTAEAADPRPPLLEYHVRVQTTDIRGAGTDATVFIMLAGTEGMGTSRINLCYTNLACQLSPSPDMHKMQGHGRMNSEDVGLGLRAALPGSYHQAHGHGLFSRGSSHDFQVEDIDVGQLTEVIIGHDGRGESSSWHLSYLEVNPFLLSCLVMSNPDRGM